MSSYRGNKTISEILRVSALQKQSAQHSSSYLVYMASIYVYNPPSRIDPDSIDQYLTTATVTHTAYAVKSPPSSALGCTDTYYSPASGQ